MRANTPSPPPATTRMSTNSARKFARETRSKMSARKLSCVAALSQNRGIGKDGTIPWRLRADMKFFVHLTTKVTEEGERNLSSPINVPYYKSGGKQNAVIMGRKTWESIPAKFRPLPNRLNIVLSRNLKALPDGAHHLCSGLDMALNLLSTEPFMNTIENIFVIGGGAVYKEALSHSTCHRLYLTHILQDFQCDVFFPEFDENVYKSISDPDVTNELQEEKAINFRFQVYQKAM